MAALAKPAARARSASRFTLAGSKACARAYQPAHGTPSQLSSEDGRPGPRAELGESTAHPGCAYPHARGRLAHPLPAAGSLDGTEGAPRGASESRRRRGRRRRPRHRPGGRLAVVEASALRTKRVQPVPVAARRRRKLYRSGGQGVRANGPGAARRPSASRVRSSSPAARAVPRREHALLQAADELASHPSARESRAGRGSRRRRAPRAHL